MFSKSLVSFFFWELGTCFERLLFPLFFAPRGHTDSNVIKCNKITGFQLRVVSCMIKRRNVSSNSFTVQRNLASKSGSRGGTSTSLHVLVTGVTIKQVWVCQLGYHNDSIQRPLSSKRLQVTAVFLISAPIPISVPIANVTIKNVNNKQTGKTTE